MCKEGPRQCDRSRSAAPAKTFKRKNNKGCGGNSYGYGRAPVLREPWRANHLSRHTLGGVGMNSLKEYLEEEIRVVPQAGSPELPVLYVSPAELIRHILARLSAHCPNTKNAAGIFVEVYGGVAQAVVSADRECDGSASPPTDFDARFYISRMGNDGRDFDRCRCFVEEYLLMKLQLASPPDSEMRNAGPAVVRYRYYQKQVVVGGSFSLLSVGDSETGKAIDLEFSCSGDSARKYFDDANSFVIPLSLQQLAGMAPVVAMTMTGSFEHAIELTRRRELLVQHPSEVINGLALYAHAVTDKHLSTPDASAEDACASELVHSFLETCASLRARFDDPLRFLRSFLRSHYAARPLSALATVVQMLGELTAYGEAQLKSQRSKDGEGDGRMELDWLLAELLAELIMAAAEKAEGDATAVLALLQLIQMARSPGDAGREEEREVVVHVGGGRRVRLVRKLQGGEVAERLCAMAAEAVTKRVSGSMAGWLQSLLGVLGGIMTGPAEEEEEEVVKKVAVASCWAVVTSGGVNAEEQRRRRRRRGLVQIGVRVEELARRLKGEGEGKLASALLQESCAEKVQGEGEAGVEAGVEATAALSSSEASGAETEAATAAESEVEETDTEVEERRRTDIGMGAEKTLEVEAKDEERDVGRPGTHVAASGKKEEEGRVRRASRGAVLTPAKEEGERCWRQGGEEGPRGDAGMGKVGKEEGVRWQGPSEVKCKLEVVVSRREDDDDYEQQQPLASPPGEDGAALGKEEGAGGVLMFSCSCRTEILRREHAHPAIGSPSSSTTVVEFAGGEQQLPQQLAVGGLRLRMAALVQAG